MYAPQGNPGALHATAVFAMLIHLGHFQAMLIFALVVSVAFGFLSRRSSFERAKYIIWSFFLFIAIAIGIGWLMYPLSR